MIKELSIQNLAVIENASLDLDSPYLSLLGETGAGKSLIVDSLLLLSGNKADKSVIRQGKKEAVVSALFSFDEKERKNYPALEGKLDEEGNLVLKRILSLNGTGRCYINGAISSLKELKDIGSLLIDIHSQGENSAILKEEKALFFVDSYDKSIAPLLADYKDSYELLTKEKKSYEAFLLEHKELDGEYLRFQIQEIEKMDLKENEIEDLEKESRELKGIARLRENYDRMKEKEDLAEGNLLDLLSTFLVTLRPFADSPLSQQAELASTKGREFLLAMDDLQESYQDLDSDPDRIDTINARLFALKGLQRKYGKTTEEILSKLQEYREKLSLLEDFDGEKERREKRISELTRISDKKAEILSKARKESAEKLSCAIGKEMADLGLLKDGFSIHFEEKELSSTGKDVVTFYVRLNKGLGESPLKKAASGGESSRLMLALKSVLNHLSPADVLVLDEIDTGVSGKAATLMAKKIQNLGKDSQVIVISHLAQVVASSHDCIQVKKVVEEGTTKVKATRLNEEKTKEEIARMISGKEVTQAALLQAEELMKEYR